MQAASAVLSRLGAELRLAVIIVQHLHKEQSDELLRFYARHTSLPVAEAAERERILSGRIYVAPPDYHLLTERDETFSLCVSGKVNWSRPSIDVLFESAADTYGPALAGVVLSGANGDGAQGLRRIKMRGGIAIVQEPLTAQFPEMPRAALRCLTADFVLPPEEIGRLLGSCGKGKWQPFPAVSSTP